MDAMRNGKHYKILIGQNGFDFNKLMVLKQKDQTENDK
jgi:hypothetical protein